MKPLIAYNYAEIGRRTGKSRQFVSAVFRGERKMPEELRGQLIDLGVIKRSRRHAKS